MKYALFLLLGLKDSTKRTLGQISSTIGIAVCARAIFSNIQSLSVGDGVLGFVTTYSSFRPIFYSIGVIYMLTAMFLLFRYELDPIMTIEEWGKEINAPRVPRNGRLNPQKIPKDPEKALKALNERLAQGKISEDEYQRRKAEILQSFIQ